MYRLILLFLSLVCLFYFFYEIGFVHTHTKKSLVIFKKCFGLSLSLFNFSRKSFSKFFQKFSYNSSRSFTEKKLAIPSRLFGIFYLFFQTISLTYFKVAFFFLKAFMFSCRCNLMWMILGRKVVRHIGAING